MQPRRFFSLCSTLTLLALLLFANTLGAQAAAIGKCDPFEDLALSTKYVVGDSFTSNGFKWTVAQHTFAGGGLAGTDPNNNFVRVENGNRAGALGQELRVNNAAIVLDIPGSTLPTPVDWLWFRFGEYGGNLNIRINGAMRNFDNFRALDGTVLGGANIQVINGFGNDMGGVYLHGAAISDFMVSGQELYIDRVCVAKKVDDNQPGEPSPGEEHIRVDLGDAPDSSNHPALANTAYAVPPTNGQFPTVWHPVAPSGPLHFDINQYWLGAAVSGEVEADLGPDSDGLNNILNGGADNADNDLADDGWLNPNAPFPNCRETGLRVRIHRAAGAPATPLFFNAWFDGNRDGDWADQGQCPDLQGGVSNEWIIPNRPINTAVITPGGFIDLNLRSVLVMNTTPGQRHWLRLSLSNRPAPAPAPGTNPDGRGPAFPNFYLLGETEDYQQQDVDLRPGQIVISKTVATNNTPVKPGAIMTYEITLEHIGGAIDAAVRITDPLPAGLHFIGPISVREVITPAGPTEAVFYSNTVAWRGSLGPNAKLVLTFPVRVGSCVGQPVTLNNIAYAKQPDAPAISDDASVTVECPSKPQVEVHKGIVLRNGNGVPLVVNQSEVLPGTEVLFEFKAVNTGESAAAVALRDRLPEGMVADEGNIVNMGFAIRPGETVTRHLRVRIVGEMVEERPLVNVAGYVSCAIQPGAPAVDLRCPWPLDDKVQRTNPVTITLAAPDHGDAPDSSNHFTATMLAYPAVPARYPTVFGPATGAEQGPRHVSPRPFHLGRGVSAEHDADLWPDADGLRNIEPPANIANRDNHDDGVRLRAVNFQHCRPSEIPVEIAISPAAVALMSEQQGVGFINVWVDGMRNGDWADLFQCPADPGQVSQIALEHIVIDQPINVTALGPGLHVITLTTNMVPWPEDKKEQPAWLRVTLSERRSNKTIAAPILHGDGRGFATPFRTGETEDYLWLPERDPKNGPDVGVQKRGNIVPSPEGSAPRIVWAIEYGNRGTDAAGVEIKDDLSQAGQLGDKLKIRSEPPLSYTLDGTQITFKIGTLPSGRNGRILIETGLPGDINSTQVFTNQVKITATVDIDPGNNRATATTHTGLRSPVIVTPGNGTTCEEMLNVRGLANPGATVELYVDGTLVATLTAGSDARWSTTVGPLSDGSHTLYAIAKQGAQSSPPSPSTVVIVNTSLTWSPLSLRFTDSHGYSHRPVDEDGRTDEEGWGIRLRRGETYTVEVKVCCDDPGLIQLTINSSLVVTMSDQEGDKIYVGNFTTVEERQEWSFALEVQCGDNTTTSSGVVLIDPEGNVYDARTGQLLSGATVSCLEAQSVAAGDGSVSTVFGLWNAAAYDQTNPQVTAADGYFSFFTPAGSYRLAVNKSGYQSYLSTDIVVVDVPVKYDVPLTANIDKAATTRILITENGFEPSVVEVAPGSVIEWLNVDVDGHTTVRSSSLAAAEAAYAAAETTWDSGLLLSGASYKLSFDTVGTYSFGDSTNSFNTATIVVKAQSQSNPTPEATQKVFLPVVLR